MTGEETNIVVSQKLIELFSAEGLALPFELCSHGFRPECEVTIEDALASDGHVVGLVTQLFEAYF